MGTTLSRSTSNLRGITGMPLAASLSVGYCLAVARAPPRRAQAPGRVSLPALQLAASHSKWTDSESELTTST